MLQISYLYDIVLLYLNKEETIMKKTALVTLASLLVVPLTSCGPTVYPDPVKIASGEDEALKLVDNKYILDFYAINDIHGSAVETKDSTGAIDEMGMERIGAFFRAKREENKAGTFFMSTGDAFQGSADSNITKGKMMAEMFNYLDFTSNTVGNHEFDWGIDTLINSLEEVDAQFPLLACNIVDKKKTADTGTTVYADWAQPYVTLERGIGEDTLKIGIIGSIAIGLEKSILSSAVRDYSFEEPLNRVKEISESLRNDGCDVIIYSTHGDAGQGKGGVINAQIPTYVDAIFTGHAHREYNDVMPRLDGTGQPTGVSIPVVQGASNGKIISNITLKIDPTDNSVVERKAVLLTPKDVEPFGKDQSMASIYNKYYDKDIAPIKNERIGRVDRDKTLDDIGFFTAKSMLKHARIGDPDIVAAFTNKSGGVRATFSKGNITYGDVYKSLPFDNNLVIIEAKGNTIREITSKMQGSAYLSYGANYDIEIPRGSLQADTLYKIVLVSYMAEHDSLKDIVDASTIYESLPEYPRDIVAQAFRDSGNPMDK